MWAKIAFADIFQSTPSAWRVTGGQFHSLLEFIISIHTLRVEGDKLHPVEVRPILISIHTLRVEGDEMYMITCFNRDKFQSTPSAWRVTKTTPAKKAPIRYFNPHPPRGG